MEVESEQDAGDEKHGRERESEIQNEIVPNGQILIVEDVEDAKNRRGINRRAITFAISR